jgi:hypothetical protein
MMSSLPPPLREVLDILTIAYPEGIGADEYYPVLLALYGDMSDENLAKVVATFIQGEDVVVGNDIARAISMRTSLRSATERATNRLLDAGWKPDEDDQS